MIREDKPTFAAIMTAHAESVGKPYTKAAVDFAFDCLKDLTLDDFKRGLLLHSRASRYLATPADILRALGGLTPSEKADRAWSKLLGAIRRVGQYESVVFEDQAITASVIHMGGWTVVCDWREDELVWRKKEFAELYKGFTASGVPLSIPVKLTGLCERENAATGRLGDPNWSDLRGCMAPIRLVGDQDACRKLLESGEDKTPEVLAKLRAMTGLESLEPDGEDAGKGEEWKTLAQR